MAATRHRPARAREAVARNGRSRGLAASRWLPSGRSLALGFGLLFLAAGAYAVARETPMFAIRQIEVEGASPEVAARVKAALRPLAGSSLVSFDRGRAAGRLTELPEVAGATYDRAFPHTLKVIVRVERPATVLRRGSGAWLVAGSGRILRQLAARPYPPLPRIWVPLSFDVGAGETLAGDPLSAVRALGSLGHVALPAHVRSVRAGDGELTFVLASELELRLGNATDLALKLAVAAQVLPRAGTASYLDVSVPERTVVGPPLSQNPQVEG